MLGLNASADYYEFVRRKGRRLGSNSWLFIAVLAAELTIILRYGRPGGWAATFPPAGVAIPWAMCIFFLGLWKLRNPSIIIKNGIQFDILFCLPLHRC